ncbi:hypothetical protein AB205_0081480 [Aquarana catesbeiana]|uniref:Uncharacterized protein n=1 Tax=Aquarana catesbeiana TaxID=8400 RepID=A0A2G9RSF9_AQUCT|nr:hypothetical protein AB205_0081480 [Aquarana catesbeiana]
MEGLFLSMSKVIQTLLRKRKMSLCCGFEGTIL